MEPGSSSKSASRIRNVNKRPDSMKLELLDAGAQKLVDNQVHLGFRKISYSVREGVFKNRNRKLLREINGDFYAGELTAIMGPSGSGKSTLMNILAGYTTRDVSGKLLVNEEHRDENAFRKKSCYIMQDDNLQPLLTVMEAMTIAANLKISSDINSKEKYTQIEEILKSLALWECRRVRTNSLSGGQRKRLAIALELLKNPQVMFFDEPTSGLDSVSTKQCILLLKKLAIEGKTVICTIHQPSASVFEMFDHLYAIAEGCCIYQGSIKGVIPYLEESGLHCPSYHNPADYLLEVANGEYGPHVEHLMGMSENGLSSDWRKRHRDTQQVQAFDHIDQMMKSGMLDAIKVPNLHYTVMPADVTDAHPIFDSQYSTSFLNQLYVLIKRTFLILSRDRTLTYSRLATHTMIALIIGVLYYRIGEDASNVLNNFNYMAFSTMFLMFTAFNCVVTTFPSEMPIIIREHFNRWYSLKAYYVAITLADIPIQMIATILYGLITYFLTFQPFESHRVAMFLAMCMLISLVSQSYALFVGACLDVKNGVIFGPFLFTPFVIFSGFFVQLNNASPYFRWIFHISFLKYGLEGMMLSVFGYDRGKIPCNADYCHYVYPEKFLDEIDMEDAVYAHAVYFLVGLVLFLRAIAYAALFVKIGRKR